MVTWGSTMFNSTKWACLLTSCSPPARWGSLDFKKGATPSSSFLFLLRASMSPSLPPRHYCASRVLEAAGHTWPKPYRKLWMQWSTPGPEQRPWAGSGGALFARWVARGAVPLCMGVALGDIHLGFAWQVWHLVTSTLVSRRRHDSRRSLAERQDRTSWQLFANNVGKNGYGISHPRL